MYIYNNHAVYSTQTFNCGITFTICKYFRFFKNPQFVKDNHNLKYNHCLLVCLAEITEIVIGLNLDWVSKVFGTGGYTSKLVKGK